MKRAKWRRVVGVLVLLGCALSGSAIAAGSYEAWVEWQKAVLQEPGLLRYYTFEPTGDGSVANLAGGEGKLAYKTAKGGPAQAEIVPGRWPQKKAVRLDQGMLEGPTFAAEKGFTAMAWVRLHGQGAMRGNNGATNGTILSSGSGYTDGWRLTITHPTRVMDFAIGRPPHSVNFHSRLTAEGVWQHVAVTWDGHETKIYLDGSLVGGGPYAEPYVPAKTMRVGFAYNGVGSVVMDIDELAVYDHALPAEAVLKKANFQSPLSQAAAELFRAARQAAEIKNFTEAAAAYTKLTEQAGLADDYRAVACLELATVLSGQQRADLAAAALSRAWVLPHVAEGHRAMAGTALLQIMPRVNSLAIAAPVYEDLLKLQGLGPKDRAEIRLHLARRYRDAGDPKAALQQYDMLLDDTMLAPRQRIDRQLERAHACVEARDFAAARSVFNAVAAANDLPAAYRTNALFCLADTAIAEKDFAGAEAALTKVAGVVNAPAHHLSEAQERLVELKRLQEKSPACLPALGRSTLLSWQEPAMTFYVARDGSDANPGTKECPFASLERARDAVRKLKTQGPLPAGGVAVLIRGGEYPVKATWQLSADDSGTAEAPIVYAAYPGETACFSGGQRLHGFQAVRDPKILARLPEEVRGKVVQIDLRKAGVADLGTFRPGGYSSGAGFRTRPMLELFFNGRPMQLARWPNTGFLKVGRLMAPETAFEHRHQQGQHAGKFTYDGDRPARWKEESDPWLYGYWFHHWADSYEKVAAIDVEQHVLTLSPPYHRYGYREGQRYFALNLLSEIDSPGEWHLDRSTGILYFYPPADPATAQVEVSVQEGALVKADRVSHVRFRGLTWELGRGNGLMIQGGEGCVLAGCTVRKLAGDAVVISGSGHQVRDCDFSELGRGGVDLNGGDRRTLKPGELVVENCHFANFSRIDHTYTPAVHVMGVGARIAHNLIHGGNSSALRVEGNDHVVEFNEVHHVVMESDDQGGVDMFGNPGYRGNVYRYNYWHHIGNDDHTGPAGQAGIRLDDAICGVLIYGNVFYRASDSVFGGVQIHGGRDNCVDNNLFLDCRTAISFSPWPESRWKEFMTEPGVVARLHREVEINQPPYSTRYPELAQIETSSNANRVWRNLAINCGQFLARDRGAEETLENYVAGANLAADSEGRGRFPLPADSPVLKRIGLRPIPFAEIGLYRSDLRKTP